MLLPRFFTGQFLMGLMVLGAGMVYAQDYPNKPIRIVTSTAGGPADFAARLIAQGISGSLGQPVVVENRGGIIPAETVSKAAPDGYTLLLDGGSFWITPLLQKTPYDVVKDFSPVTQIIKTPSLLVVHPTLPVKSVKELIALAKAKPGALNYSSSVIGSAPHLAAELFKAMANVNIVLVPYKGTVPALNGLLGAETQMYFSTLEILGMVKSGQVRLLAVTSAQPSTLVPDVPTIAATLPGYEWENKRGIFAPAKTPAALINRLNQEIVRTLNRADVKERLLGSGGGETVGSSPQEFAAALNAEIARIGKVIKDNNIRME